MPFLARVLACASLLSLATCSGDPAPPLPGADVDLVIDDQGITHVYARSDRDAMFGAGYAVARDRLLQMELLRRRVMGTQAEVLGAAIAVEDFKARAFDLRGLGIADARRLRHDHPDDAGVIEAWTAGVNRRIEEIRSGAFAKELFSDDEAGRPRFAL